MHGDKSDTKHRKRIGKTEKAHISGFLASRTYQDDFGSNNWGFLEVPYTGRGLG